MTKQSHNDIRRQIAETLEQLLGEKDLGYLVLAYNDEIIEAMRESVMLRFALWTSREDRLYDEVGADVLDKELKRRKIITKIEMR